MSKSIAIAGIHTGIGKTVVSAVVAEALGADYWKPVQAGLEERDSDALRQWLTNGPARVHPEAVALTQPLSPHAAAAIDGVTIDHTTLQWPKTNRLLIVETAGGLFSPMTDTATMADFMYYYRLPAILVVQNYLGSINHTLLTIEALRSRGIPLLGIVVNGIENEASEQFIVQYSQTPIIARVPQMLPPNQQTITQCAHAIKPALTAALQKAGLI